MNINIQAHIIKRASQILCKQVNNGNTLVRTAVRNNGSIIEWYLSNGDMIEIVNNHDYSSGLCLTPTTSICLYHDDEIIFEQCYTNG